MARETATRALHSDDGRVACPAEGCQASLSLETLAALLPPEENQAARNRSGERPVDTAHQRGNVALIKALNGAWEDFERLSLTT